MLNRRQFNLLGLGTALHTVLPSSLKASPAKTGVTLSGQFGFKIANGKLVVDVKDALIGGLTIPALTWGWVGLAIASGLLEGLGAALFGALNDAIFGKQGKTIEQYLAELMNAFKGIIADALIQNDIRNFSAEVDDYGLLY